MLCECGCGRKTSVSTRADTTRNMLKGQPARFVNGHNTRGHKCGSPNLRKCAHCAPIADVVSMKADAPDAASLGAREHYLRELPLWKARRRAEYLIANAKVKAKEARLAQALGDRPRRWQAVGTMREPW